MREQKEISQFEKQPVEPELISDKFEMIEIDDAKVLDTTQLSSKEMSRLKQIIEAKDERVMGRKVSS